MNDGKYEDQIEQERKALIHRQNNGSSRISLPDERQAITHHFTISGHDGYVTVGLYADGSPGEVFITMAKEGSTIGGLVDCIGILTSLALQHGVPIEHLARKLRGTSFEPAGFTPNERIRTATSVIDYIFRWLEMRFREPSHTTSQQPIELPSKKAYDNAMARYNQTQPAVPVITITDTGIGCPDCGQLLVMEEGCMKCYSCGYTKC